MKKYILIILLFTCSGLAYPAEPVFWPYGSAIYTYHALWLKRCNTESIDGKKYRIGTDIVACVTKTKNGKPNDLLMANARRFAKRDLDNMHPSTKYSIIPPRNHRRFKCLDISRGWVC